MGISIASMLLGIHGFQWAALVFLVLGWTIFVVLAGGWIKYRSPRFEAAVMPAWGMAAMGIMSLGSATSSTFGNSSWWIHLAFWVLGSALGVFVCLSYTRTLFTGRAGSPTFSWGLPLVAPMVAATTGMQLHGQLLLIGASAIPTTLVLVVSAVMFILALLLAIPVFSYVYLQIIGPQAQRSGTDLLPPMAAPTAWIPLGVIGQSTAAAQLLALGFGWPEVGIGYGTVLLAVSVPLAGWALWRHYPVAFHLRYSPTWWSATFPVGTCCLGSHALALTTGAAWLDIISIGILMLLLVHVAWAIVGFLLATLRGTLG